MIQHCFKAFLDREVLEKRNVKPKSERINTQLPNFILCQTTAEIIRAKGCVLAGRHLAYYVILSCHAATSIFGFSPNQKNNKKV